MSETKTASEGGHFYTKEGTPAYEVPYADPSKGMRKTTLRDAKKLQLCESVTRIMGVADRPALTAYKVNQALDAALTLPREEGESLDAFKPRALADAKEHARVAAEKGKAIHACVEKALWEKDYDPTYICEVEATLDTLGEILENPLKLATETPFAHRLGYGGKVDLWGDRGDAAVLDLKTKDFPHDVDVAKKLAWPEQLMQLTAYAEGLMDTHRAAGLDGWDYKRWPRLINVYISRSEPGVVRWHEWKPEQADVAWAKFLCLLRYRQLDTQYVPEWAERVS